VRSACGGEFAGGFLADSGLHGKSVINRPYLPDICPMGYDPPGAVVIWRQDVFSQMFASLCMSGREQNHLGMA